MAAKVHSVGVAKRGREEGERTGSVLLFHSEEWDLPNEKAKRAIADENGEGGSRTRKLLCEI